MHKPFKIIAFLLILASSLPDSSARMTFPDETSRSPLVVCWALPTGSTWNPPRATLEAPTIPRRLPDAITGTDFAEKTSEMTEPDRQQAAVDELERGNIPDFLRHLKPVYLSGSSPSGQVRRATVWVTPDYLSIGSDTDFIRFPLDYFSATTVAARYGFVLPTRHLVDAIYQQSAIHLVPQPLPAGPLMRSCAYSLEHRQKIEKQREGCPLGDLIAGHKKDLVLTNRLVTRPDRVAIYGWHRPDGQPIQPLSTWHGVHYTDYSHAVRLVYETVWIDGKSLSIYDVLQDPELAGLLSDEGPIEQAWALMHPGSSDDVRSMVPSSRRSPE